MRSTTLGLVSLVAVPVVAFSSVLNTDVTLRDNVTREVIPYAIVDVTMKSRMPVLDGEKVNTIDDTRVVRYFTNVNGSFSYPASGDTLNEAVSLKVYKSGYGTRELPTGLDGQLSTNDAGKSLSISVPTGAYAKLAVAGVRSSNYGASKTVDNEGSDDFPRPNAFKSVTKHVANSIGATRPAVIWIVSEVAYDTDGENWYPSKNTLVQFEKPENCTVNYKNTLFSSEGAEYTGADGEVHFYSHEEYLKYFEKNGIDVYLQIESGQADVIEQFNLVLDKFKGYSCVKGIGIDVEFYNYHVVDDNNTADLSDDVWENDPLTDAVAQSWYKAVKAKGERYSLFLKHFRPGDMPPTYRGAKNDIIYVDDTQDMGDITNFLSNKTADGHIDWANAFYPNPVWFQIGYSSDWDGHGDDADPKMDPWFESAVGSKNSGNVLWGLSSALAGTAKRDQKLGIIWVDFTMKKLFPQSFTTRPAVAAPAWSRAKTYQRGAFVMYGGATWEATYWAKGAVPGGSATWKMVTNKDQVQDWITGTPYNNGDRVMCNDQTWQARWWTQGDKPGTTDVWQALATEDAAEWSMTQVYTAGTNVVFEGQTWQARWWTKGDQPGNSQAWLLQ